jgi:excisionase family DNA binding protein
LGLPRDQWGHTQGTTDTGDISVLFDPKFLTVSEIADIMRISRGSVYRKIDSGDIESVRVGNSIRVPESVFVAYMEDIGLAWMVKEAGLTSTARPLADPALEVERAVQLLVVHLPRAAGPPASDRHEGYRGVV